jgi:hypothetical protein
MLDKRKQNKLVKALLEVILKEYSVLLSQEKLDIKAFPEEI